MSAPQEGGDAGASAVRCPLLVGASGAWVASSATRGHRCGAVEPPAILALEKQRRLCLTPAHRACATFVAREAARAERVPPGSPLGWGWVRTTPVIETTTGLTSSMASALGDRRPWQWVLATVLVVAVIALGLQNLVAGPGATGVSATPTPTPIATAPSAQPSVTPAPTPSPTVAPTPSPTPSPTPGPTATPAPTATPTASAHLTYVVKSGDTLTSIARKFNTTVAAIKELNGMTSDFLRAGQTLLIP